MEVESEEDKLAITTAEEELKIRRVREQYEKQLLQLQEEKTRVLADRKRGKIAEHACRQRLTTIAMKRRNFEELLDHSHKDEQALHMQTITVTKAALVSSATERINMLHKQIRSINKNVKSTDVDKVYDGYASATDKLKETTDAYDDNQRDLISIDGMVSEEVEAEMNRLEEEEAMEIDNSLPDARLQKRYVRQHDYTDDDEAINELSDVTLHGDRDGKSDGAAAASLVIGGDNCS